MMISDGIVDQELNNVNKFWMLYRDAIIGLGTPKKKAEWHVHWAQKLKVSIKKEILKTKTSS